MSFESMMYSIMSGFMNINTYKDFIEQIFFSRAAYSPAVLDEAKSVGPLQKELLLILKEIRIITEKVKEIQFVIEKSLKGVGKGNQYREVNLLASKYKIDILNINWT